MQRGTVAGVSLVSAVDESLRMVTLHQTIISQEVSWQFFYLHHYSAVFSLTYLVARRTCGGQMTGVNQRSVHVLVSMCVCVCVIFLVPSELGWRCTFQLPGNPPLRKLQQWAPCRVRHGGCAAGSDSKGGQRCHHFQIKG